MARPKVDKEIRPCTRLKYVAVTRLTRARQSINESAILRMERILRENTSLDASLGNLFGNINGARRKLEDGQVDGVRQWCVDVAAQALAILACYEKC